ncbi:MAG: hypothetical protein AABX48_02275 [Nanoarchaeota archaeon]
MITQKREKFTIFILLFCLVFSAALVSAVTAKIGNARMVLYPEFEGGKAILEKSIKVINDNNVSVNITLAPDEGLKNITEIIDSNFILEPGEEKDAAFVITIKEEGNYNGRINVFFKGIEDKSGVALSSTVIIYAYKNNSDRETNADRGINTGGENNDNGVVEETPFNLTAFTVKATNNLTGLGRIETILIGSTIISAIALVCLLYVLKKKEDGNLEKGGKRGDKKKINVADK